MRSVKSRFLVSFAANVLRAGIGFASGLLVARGLHPAAYGSLMFLLSSFVAAKSLLDLGTSNAYYTLLAREPRNARFHLAYFAWLAFQFGACLLAITLVFPQRVIAEVWLGHARGIVLAAFIASFMQQQVWQTVVQVGEAARRTALVQGMGAAIGVFQFVAVAVMFARGWLSIVNVLLLYAVEHAAATLIACAALTRGDESAARVDRPMRDLLREYYVYCKPLALLAVVSFIFDFADRWLLQRFGGSVQQGFFQIANQFSSVALLATTSILRIFWKEVADPANEAAGALYRKVNRGLVAAGAVLSAMLVPWSRVIVRETLGTSYLGAWPVLAIMLLYPIHQSMGQISGTFFLARGETRTMTKITVVAVLASVIASYIVLGVAGLGASGLAVKLVVVQIITTNVQAWIIARENRWRFDWLHQVVCIAAVIGIAWAAFAVVGMLWPLDVPLMPALIAPIAVYIILYIGAVGLLLLRVPSLAGVER